MKRRYRRIALLTDFGKSDPYAASLKGVLVSRAPGVEIHDLSHDIPPFDAAAAGRFLKACEPYWPEGTLFLAVVDPGVGSSRKILAIDDGRCVFLGPDNGLFTFLHGRKLRIRSLTPVPVLKVRRVAPTFHGRDLMAPAAAYLAQGGELRKLGPEVRGMKVLGEPLPKILPRGLRGQIVSFDHYGNGATNLRPEHWRGRKPGRVRLVSGKSFHLVRTYAESAGKLCALINSAGVLEIARAGQSAQKKDGLRIGDTVEVIYEKD